MPEHIWSAYIDLCAVMQFEDEIQSGVGASADKNFLEQSYS